MTVVRRSLWQASVVCLFLSVAVCRGEVIAYNPLDGTVSGNFGTNTGSAGQMLTPDANGNLYWSDVLTNSAGGGGGSITGETQYIWADSVPLETTNPPASRYATNLVSSISFSYLGYDKDAQMWAGPQTLVTADNWNSNIVFEINSWGNATGDVQYLFRLSSMDGRSATYTSGTYEIDTQLNLTNMARHTWALTTSGFTSDTWYAYEFGSQVTSGIDSAGAREGDHNIQQVKTTWISE